MSMNERRFAYFPRSSWSEGSSKVVFAHGDREQFENTIMLIAAADEKILKYKGNLAISWIPKILADKSINNQIPRGEIMIFAQGFYTIMEQSEQLMLSNVSVCSGGSGAARSVNKSWATIMALEAIVDYFDPTVTLSKDDSSFKEIFDKKDLNELDFDDVVSVVEIPNITSHMTVMGRKLMETLEKHNYRLPEGFQLGKQGKKQR